MTDTEFRTTRAPSTSGVPGLRRYPDNLAFYGIEQVRHALVVPAGRIVVLDTTPGGASAVPFAILTTGDLDQLKAWIGVPDIDYELGALPPRPLPDGLPWLTGDPAAAGSPEAMTLVRQAYVHGYSKLVEQGKASIEAAIGEFEVACAAIDTIVVEPEASLVIQGELPVLLLCREFTLNAPGSMKLFTEARICVDRMVRTDPPGGTQ